VRLLLVLPLLLGACSDKDTELRMPADASFDVVLIDPTEAGGGHEGHTGHATTCETIGRTGGADTCLLFAYCGHSHFQLDCAARFTCVCSEPEVDGGPTKQIVAQSIFCESVPSDLKPAFAAAQAACGW